MARQRLAALSAALTARGFPERWGLWWRDRHNVGLIVAPSARHAGMLRARSDEILAAAAWSKKSVRRNSAFAISDTAYVPRPYWLVRRLRALLEDSIA